MKLTERMRELRKQHHFTQAYIAANAGISLRAYCHYEAGTREPSASTLLALANFYSVSTDYLLGTTNNPRKMF